MSHDMNDIWTDRLSEYLDGELTVREQGAMEQHLEDCAACRTTLAELTSVVSAARGLEDRGPGQDLWSAIARSAAPRRRVSMSFMELLAASVFIALVSGLTVWVVTGRERHVGPPDAAASAVPVAVTSPGDATYDRAVADLLQALDEGRTRLSPRTIEVVERSVSTVDRAISEASAALDRDPGNVFLSLHLARERQRKLALLRQVQDIAARAQ